MFTKKRIILAIVLMLMSIMLAQGVRSYFQGQAAMRAQPAHNKPGDRHHPVFVSGVDAAANPLASDNRPDAHKLKLLADDGDHAGWIAGQAGGAPGQDDCAIPCADGNFIALDDRSGFFIPGPAGNNLTPGGNTPAGDIPQSDGNPGPNPKPRSGATALPQSPAGPFADNPPNERKPSPHPFMPPNVPIPPGIADLPGTPGLPSFPDVAGPVVTTTLDRTNTHSVPEPASLALIAIGLLSMVWLGKKPDPRAL